jgi:glucose-6-phosphate 1-dehydrogenase
VRPRAAAALQRLQSAATSTPPGHALLRRHFADERIFRVDHYLGKGTGRGAVRDVVQNHLLHVLASLTMDAPNTDTAGDQHDARNQLLRAVRPVDPADVVRGQYIGYRDAAGVAPGSRRPRPTSH